METEMNADMMLEEYRRYLIYNEKSKSTVSKYVRDAGKFLDFLQTCGGTEDKITKENAMHYKTELMGRVFRRHFPGIFYAEWFDCLCFFHDNLSLIHIFKVFFDFR